VLEQLNRESMKGIWRTNLNFISIKDLLKNITFIYPWIISLGNIYLQEDFEDTKGVIRIYLSKKNRQHNGQKKKYKRTTNDPQNIHIKLKIAIIFQQLTDISQYLTTCSYGQICAWTAEQGKYEGDLKDQFEFHLH
jgi:hypothetical protein